MGININLIGRTAASAMAQASDKGWAIEWLIPMLGQIQTTSNREWTP